MGPGNHRPQCGSSLVETEIFLTFKNVYKPMPMTSSKPHPRIFDCILLSMTSCGCHILACYEDASTLPILIEEGQEWDSEFDATACGFLVLLLDWRFAFILWIVACFISWRSKIGFQALSG